MRKFRPAIVIALIGWTSACLTQISVAKPILKGVQQRTAKYAQPDLALKADPNRMGKLGLCLRDWDPVTHMSRTEWNRACERSVRLFPDAFR
jgi:predicted DNA-binding protein (MmcQ/YjbR family)